MTALLGLVLSPGRNALHDDAALVLVFLLLVLLGERELLRAGSRTGDGEDPERSTRTFGSLAVLVALVFAFLIIMIVRLKELVP